MKKCIRLFSTILAFAILLCTVQNFTVYAANDAGELVSIGQKEVGTTNGTKYRTWFYGKNRSVAWCAIFVSWCANQAGIPTSVIPKSASCIGLYNGILSGGGKIVTSPQMGDLVFYKIGSNLVHVGIMENSSTSVQGNLGGKVKSIVPSKYYNKGQSYSMIYVRPNYNKSEDKIFVLTDTVTELTETSVRLNGHFQSNYTVHITEHGAYLGTSPDSMVKVAVDNVNYNKSKLTMFYRTGKYYGDLTPGTTYYYQQYMVIDGKEYKGDVLSFTTTGEAAAPVVSLSSYSIQEGEDVTVSWTSVSNAKDYHLEIQNVDTGNTTHDYLSSCSDVLSDLGPGKYKIIVRSSSGDIQGRDSDPVYLTVLEKVSNSSLSVSNVRIVENNGVISAVVDYSSENMIDTITAFMDGDPIDLGAGNYDYQSLEEVTFSFDECSGTYELPLPNLIRGDAYSIEITVRDVSGKETTVSTSYTAAYHTNSDGMVVSSWRIGIPAHCYVACYASVNDTVETTRYKEKSEPFSLYCTDRVHLPNGAVRYYFKSGQGRMLWFTYTYVMSVS